MPRISLEVRRTGLLCLDRFTYLLHLKLSLSRCDRNLTNLLRRHNCQNRISSGCESLGFRFGPSFGLPPRFLRCVSTKLTLAQSRNSRAKSRAKSRPGPSTAILGGLVMNFGGGNTTNVVVADASPKRFVALHAYEPESLLIVLRKVINSLHKVTLFFGKTPVNFVRVTVGDGKPVTWHRGSLMFCPVLARMGPGDILTRGGAGKK